jgi:hypothetical protein
VTCLLADGQRCEVTDAVKLHVKLLSFSWDHEFKVLRGGPFPAILGLDFFYRTKMLVDVASRKFTFGFAPSWTGTFSVPNLDVEVEPYLQNLCEEASNMTTVSEVWLNLAFGTAVHESTKCTPDKLFLGRELKCPLLVRWDLSSASTDGTGEPNHSFWTQTYKNLMQARRKVARRYDVNCKAHQFQLGDTVVYRTNLASSKAQNILAKLLLRWSKPMVIAKIVKPNVVLLAKSETRVIGRRAHVSQLKALVG